MKRVVVIACIGCCGLGLGCGVEDDRQIAAADAEQADEGRESVQASDAVVSPWAPVAAWIPPGASCGMTVPESDCDIDFQQYWTWGCGTCLVDYCMEKQIAASQAAVCFEGCNNNYGSPPVEPEELEWCLDQCTQDFDNVMCPADEALDDCEEWNCP
ncbi:MAG: hypothetical protein KDK70_16215 [Myxococcales bacterium]|nr:hypothetical protein [Myxococcales bacterium]